MLRYVLKRLGLAVPTLVGITIVTFLIIHLAPGDPVVASSRGAIGPGGMTKDEIEKLRRLYFLDLPLFFNFDPQDRRHIYAGWIRELIDAEDPTTRSNDLRRRGTVVVPSLWKHRTHPRVALLLRQICQKHKTICPGGDLAALLKASRHPRPNRDWGTAALWPLMDLVWDGTESERIAAIAELAEIMQNATTYGPDASEEQRESVLDDWSEWWFVHEREYREFSSTERVLGVVTETQYAKWIRRVATGSFGYSFAPDHRPVSEKIREAFPVTALLALLAAFFAYVIAIPLGVWSAVRHGSWWDRAIGTTLFVLYSLPSFWVASMLVLLLGGVGYWDVLPIYGFCPRGAEDLPTAQRIAACAPHWVLPVFCLTYTSLAVISRYQRSGMLDVVRQDYIRTARAKGLSERAVILKHAFRNSLLPVITYLGLHIPFLLGGSIIVEKIFSIRGMGLLVWDSIGAHDYPTLMGTTVVAALITMTGVLVADLLYAAVDPRIAYDKR